MEEHFRQIWIEKWIESVLHFLRQIDKDGVRKYFHYICSNKNLTLEYIDKHLADKISQDKYFYYISSNPYLTFEYVIKRLDKNWDWDAISRHPNITLDMILSTLNNSRCKWNISEVIKNPNITYEMLTTHEYFTNNQRGSDWLWYCHNPTATFAELNKHIKNFRGYITFCPNLTLADVFANPEINWSATVLLQNPRIGKNVSDEDLRKLANIVTKTTDADDVTANEVYKYLQRCVTCLYGTPEKVKKLDKECNLSLDDYLVNYLHNPYLQINECLGDMRKRNYFDVSIWLKNDLARNRDNFISTHVSQVLLANMHHKRSKICYENDVEKVIADEWILNHVMKYV